VVGLFLKGNEMRILNDGTGTQKIFVKPELPTPLEERVAALERKVRELERRLAGKDEWQGAPWPGFGKID